MKKLISILLFSTICLGTKTLGSEDTRKYYSEDTAIYCYGLHHMDVRMRNGKTYFFENPRIEFMFLPMSYNHLSEWGRFSIRICDLNPEAYKKIKQMMDEIQDKTKAIPFPEGNGWDKNGIKYYSTITNARWNGYAGFLFFKYSDIERIDLY